jgi:class 3 adenylate cyclase
LEKHFERKLAAILAADVVGYSRLMEADEVGTLRALKTVRKELVDPSIAAFGGRIVKTTGDGLLVDFASVVDAVACAVAIQRKMIEGSRAIPEEKRLVFRIGINIGDIIIDGNDIFGDGVNIAARLESISEPGGLCISDIARDQVRDKVAVSVRRWRRAAGQEYRPAGPRLRSHAPGNRRCAGIGARPDRLGRATQSRNAGRLAGACASYCRRGRLVDRTPGCASGITDRVNTSIVRRGCASNDRCAASGVVRGCQGRILRRRPNRRRDFRTRTIFGIRRPLAERRLLLQGQNSAPRRRRPRS